MTRVWASSPGRVCFTRPHRPPSSFLSIVLVHLSSSYDLVLALYTLDASPLMQTWTSRRAQSSQHPLALAASLRSLGLPPSFARVLCGTGWYGVCGCVPVKRFHCSSSLSCSRSRLSRYLPPRITQHLHPEYEPTLPVQPVHLPPAAQDQHCTCQVEEGQEVRDGDVVPAWRRDRTQGPCYECVQEDQGRQG
ncbi:hypothetical protein EXIGLDRAFT_476083 [Exidia glandulosa HHB12029]|uniref:Uncharacterized protein n=1 Tax=Exidia glandulosa HHB12029 TaxID=1314781 RepID=A0A166NK91_EXIGL|nr:hypothetical protein EXIGLDRAFT_476083 [Exidia glandulosa HHB12029]